MVSKITSKAWTPAYSPPLGAGDILVCIADDIYLHYYDGEKFVDDDYRQIDIDYWMELPLSFYQLKDIEDRDARPA